MITVTTSEGVVFTVTFPGTVRTTSTKAEDKAMAEYFEEAHLVDRTGPGLRYHHHMDHELILASRILYECGGGTTEMSPRDYDESIDDEVVY